MRRLQARFVTSSQEAQSPSAPDEGSAFNGWTGLDERRRKCCPDNVGCKPPVQAKKRGGCVVNRRGGAPGGARAGSAARGRLRKGAQLYLAPIWRSASLRGGKPKAPSGARRLEREL